MGEVEQQGRLERLEAVLALQRALSDGLLEDVFPSFVARLAEELSFEAAVVYAVVDNEVELLATHALEGAPAMGDEAQPGFRVPFGGVLLGEALGGANARSSGAVFVSGHRAPLAPWATHSAVLPLVMHDAVVGLLVLHARHPLVADDEARAHARSLLGLLGEPLAMAIRNAGLVARLRTTTREWERTFDAMDAMVVVVEADGQIRRANRAFARRFGATATGVTPRSIASMFPSQTLPNAFQRRAVLVGPDGQSVHATASVLGDGAIVLVFGEVDPDDPRHASRRSTGVRLATGMLEHRARVLVADDEPSILRAVSRTLGRFHDLTITTDGDEAIAAIRAARGSFDAIVTDIQMARVSGLDLYAAVERDHPQLAERIVFMTGGVFGGEIELFLRSLGPRVLRKPFDPEALRRAVEERVALSSRVA